MRTKRSKAYKKAMALYTNAFKFREPYQVLCDAAFVQSIAKQKVELISRLADVLGGSVKPMITQCSIAHLYKAGAEGQQAVNFARSLERRKCNHWQTKDTDAECIAGVIGTETNRLNYIVATQSTKLRADMRKVPGVPLLFEKRSIILMEPPSEASMGKRKEIEQGKLHAPKSELRPAKSKKRTADEAAKDDAEAEPVSGALAASALPPATRSTAAALPATAEQLLARRDRKRKRAHKEPNPLSVKKKKAKKLNTASRATDSASGKGKQKDEADSAAKETLGNGADTAESKKENQDPTKGITRPLGDGSSKKALARKRRKAAQSGDAGSAGSDAD